MAKCAFCDTEIEFLPFKCKYCGKLFCKKHRLPETHDCSFEFKDYTHLVKRIESRRVPEYRNSTQNRSYGTYSRPTIRRLGRTSIQSRFSSGFQKLKRLSGVQILIIANLVMFVLTFFPVLQEFLFLSASDYLPPNYWYHTILTAMIIPALPFPYSIIDVLFFIIIIFFMGRSIESRFGRKIFLKIYFLGALITGGVIIALQLLFSLFIFGNLDTMYYSSMGGILALIAFISRLMPENEVTFFLYFIPIRMRMKYLLWIFIGFQFLSVFFGDYIQALGNIFGAFGGILVLKSLVQLQQPTSYY
ncbi:MAG: rhomboid family intramembrane serine protease [Promethearchaeota archaeon]